MAEGSDLLAIQAIEELQQVPMQEEVIKDSIVNDKEWILYKINSYNNITFNKLLPFLNLWFISSNWSSC